MQRPCHQLLAGTRFAIDHHRRMRARQAADGAEHLLHRRRLPEDFGNQPDFAGRTDLVHALVDRPADQFIAVALSMHYDEDVDVYINGVLATQAPGFSASYEPFILTSEAFAAIKPGPNVLAAHCRQKSGGQYFDLGINGFTGP